MIISFVVRFIYVYILCVLMTSINISLKREAYELLKQRRTKNESFSDVVISEFKKKLTPLDFFGVLKDKDWGDAEKKMKSFRESFNFRLRK